MTLRIGRKSWIERFETQKERVECCLKKWPDLANCDAKLTAKIWEIWHKDVIIEGKYISLDDLHLIPRQDNIRRIRAKFNEQKMYMPTDPKVLKRRRRLEEKWNIRMKDSI